MDIAGTYIHSEGIFFQNSCHDRHHARLVTNLVGWYNVGGLSSQRHRLIH